VGWSWRGWKEINAKFHFFMKNFTLHAFGDAAGGQLLLTDKKM